MKPLHIEFRFSMFLEIFTDIFRLVETIKIICIWCFTFPYDFAVFSCTAWTDDFQSLWIKLQTKYGVYTVNGVIYSLSINAALQCCISNGCRWYNRRGGNSGTCPVNFQMEPMWAGCNNTAQLVRILHWGWSKHKMLTLHEDSRLPMCW